MASGDPKTPRCDSSEGHLPKLSLSKRVAFCNFNVIPFEERRVMKAIFLFTANRTIVFILISPSRCHRFMPFFFLPVPASEYFFIRLYFSFWIFIPAVT
jgi:hypothetical protein